MKLRVLKGLQPGQNLKLTDAPFQIGREEDNDFVISQNGVSRHHCRFSLVEGEWLVEDLGSVNGILVNGKRVDGGMLLHEGDEITVFDHVFKLEKDDEEAVPLPVAEADSAVKSASAPAAVRRGPSPAAFMLAVKIAVLVLILAAIGVLVFMLFQDEPKPDNASADSPETAAAASVAETPDDASAADAEPKHARGDSLLGSAEQAPQPAEAAPAAPATPPPPPAATDKPDETAPAANTVAAPAKPADEEPAETAPATPRKRSQVPVAVVIRTEPAGAAVSVNGQPLGASPAVINALPDDELSIEMTKNGYERLIKRLSPTAEEFSEPFRLVQKVGSLVVTSEPAGATVYEGRIVYGQTPLTLENVREGSHELRIECLGYESRKETVNLTAAKGEALDVKLTKILGSLEITTIPAGCQVFVDGLLFGTTAAADEGLESLPLTCGNLMPGGTTVRVLHPASGVYENAALTIPKGQAVSHRFFLWIPTHKVILKTGKTAVGMLIKQNDEGVELIGLQNKREHFAAADFTEIVEISKEDQALILKNSQSGREPSGQLSTKSDLSVTADEFAQRCRYPSIRAFKGKRICLTGNITMRMKTPKGVMIHYGKQLRCMLAPSAPAEDYQKIGELDDQKQNVTLRGVYEGAGKDGVHVLTDCVLLPYPD